MTHPQELKRKRRDPIEIVNIEPNAITVRSPLGVEYGIAFYPPREGDPSERVIVTKLELESARGPLSGAPRHHAPPVSEAVTSGSTAPAVERGEIRADDPRRRQEQTMYICGWNPKPHRFCGGPGKRQVR